MDTSAILLAAFFGMPMFFLWRRVFRKLTPVLKRRLITWLLTIITAPMLYAMVILIFFGIAEYYPNRDFDRNEWLANKDIRYEYSHDLIDRKILIGKTKKKVLQILGTNTDTSQNDELEYDIGFRPEITGIDPSYILVDFKNGKVVTVSEIDK